MPVRMLNPLMRSINDANRLAKARAVRSACLLLCCLAWAQSGSALGVLPDLHFSADTLEYGDCRLSGVEAGVARDGTVQLSFERLHGPGEQYVGNGLILEGDLEELSLADETLKVRSNIRARDLNLELTVVSRAGRVQADLVAQAQPLASLRSFDGLPPELSWMSEGLFDLGLAWRQAPEQPAELTFRLALEQLSFDSPDGRFAGAAMRFSVDGSVRGEDLSRLRLAGAVKGGEMLIDDFYRNFSGADLVFEAAAKWTEAALEIPSLQVRDDAALSLDGSATLGFGARRDEWSLEVDNLELQFPLAYRRYLEPLAAASTLDGLELTGRLAWNGAWGPDGLQSGDLDIRDLSIVDTQRGRFALTGLETQLRPGDHAFESRLSWRGLILGRINLGAGEAALDSEPGAIALMEPLSLDVLGGRLRLQRLKVMLPGVDGAGEGPDIQLEAGLDQVDMEQLTAAFGWPSFRGKISGEIPGVSLIDGVLGVEGEIRVRVFDGLITLQNLSMERPFGVLPSLAADLEVRGLDLDQLTQTFSFGHISGRLDGHVHDLRMLDWKPVAFDAWLGTPADQGGSNDISRQAVNNLTTIGGGPVTAALTNPLMRMFSNFSYRRLGLGCRLVDYVCELQGLSGDPDSVLILEGAGIPKITIRAFNRRIDWPQMVANLLAVSAGDEIRVGNAPDS
jgi:hypothetical protein